MANQFCPAENVEMLQEEQEQQPQEAQADSDDDHPIPTAPHKDTTDALLVPDDGHSLTRHFVFENDSDTCYLMIQSLTRTHVKFPI